jgi:hypothetical protein
LSGVQSLLYRVLNLASQPTVQGAQPREFPWHLLLSNRSRLLTCRSSRTALNDSAATAIAASIDGGTTTFATYQAGLIAQTATTTTAAFALSTFVEGVVPTSARIDSLTAFAKTQFDYYTNTLKSANAQLGAYEALGKAFAADPTTSATFAARYGALSATDFVTTAYASIFDASPVPSSGALANLVGQVAYFTDLYTKAGIPAADAPCRPRALCSARSSATLRPARMPSAASRSVELRPEHRSSDHTGCRAGSSRSHPVDRLRRRHPGRDH